MLSEQLKYSPEYSLDRLLASRRSIRTYTSEPVPEEMIRSMVAAAVTAPSPSNSQPVRFLNIASRPVRDALKNEMTSGFSRLSKKAGACEKPAKLKNVINYYWRYAEFMLDAPVLLAVGTTDQDNSALQRLKQADLPAADFSHNTALDLAAGFSIAALILKARELGLGTCMLTAPFLFIRETGFITRENNLRLNCFVTVGFPGETPARPNRLPVEQVYSRVE